MAENQPLDVGIGEWRYARRHRILRARLVSTGVAVALSNRLTGIGYLGFFTLDSVLQFRGMVRTALEAAARPDHVLMWFSGAAYVVDSHMHAREINAEVLELRQIVAGQLNEAGFRLIEGSWLNRGKCLNMTLRSGTDQCMIHRLDDPYAR